MSLFLPLQFHLLTISPHLCVHTCTLMHVYTHTHTHTHTHCSLISSHTELGSEMEMPHLLFNSTPLYAIYAVLSTSNSFPFPCIWLISISQLKSSLYGAPSGKLSLTLQVWLSYLFFVLPQGSVNTPIIAYVSYLVLFPPKSYKLFEDKNLKPGSVKTCWLNKL